MTSGEKGFYGSFCGVLNQIFIDHITSSLTKISKVWIKKLVTVYLSNK